MKQKNAANSIYCAYKTFSAPFTFYIYLTVRYDTVT